MRVSDADRNGTMRRLQNALALGLINIDEFEQRTRQVSYARTRDELDTLVGDLPAPGAIVTSATDRVELRGWAGSLKRHGEWTVPTTIGLEKATNPVLRAPILRPDLARSRGFVLGTVVAMCWFGSSLGTGLVTTLFLQEGLGLSPLVAGLCTLPSAIGMGCASALAWRVVGRWGRPSVTWALVLLVLVLLGTVAAVGHLPAPQLPLVLAGAQLLAGVAGGLVTAPNQGLALAYAPPGANGLAAGFFQVSQRISSTVCLAAFTGVFVGAATPGALGGYRTGLATGLWIATALTVVGAAASACDRRPATTCHSGNGG